MRLTLSLANQARRRQECEECGGIGQFRIDDRWVDCRPCKGTGVFHRAADGCWLPGPVGFAPDKVESR